MNFYYAFHEQFGRHHFFTRYTDWRMDSLHCFHSLKITSGYDRRDTLLLSDKIPQRMMKIKSSPRYLLAANQLLANPLRQSIVNYVCVKGIVNDACVICSEPLFLNRMVSIIILQKRLDFEIGLYHLSGN